MFEEGVRVPVPAMTLGIYWACFDASQTAPTPFRADEMHDLSRPGSLSGPPPNLTAIGLARLLSQASEDGEPGDFAPVFEWPRFFYGFEPGRVPVFPASMEWRASALEQSIEWLRACLADLFVGSEAGSLRGFAPTRVFASPAHLKVLVIRDPAFEVLGRHGLLPSG
jgi:hypothetical protein